jgi:DNA-binding transcriptional MerR regulator
LSEGLPIGRVAAEVGLSIDTIRYYERAGLMPLISRAPNGHRRYAEDDLGWIALLKCLRTTGMPISEMRHYADLLAQGESTVAQRRELLEDHRIRLGQRLREIEEQMPVLNAKISTYGGSEAELDLTEDTEKEGARQ